MVRSDIVLGKHEERRKREIFLGRHTWSHESNLLWTMARENRKQTSIHWADRIAPGTQTTSIFITLIRLGITPTTGGITSSRFGTTLTRPGITPTRGGITPTGFGITPTTGGITPTRAGTTPTRLYQAWDNTPKKQKSCKNGMIFQKNLVIYQRNFGKLPKKL